MLKRENSGAVLVETAFILPLLLLLIFGIIEVYRMRIAERFVDNVATSIAVDLSSRREQDQEKIIGIIEDIIKRCNAENSIRIMNDSEINSRFTWNIGLHGVHNTFRENLKADDSDSSFDRGDMIMVTCNFKYEFITQLTKMAFMGGKNKDLTITKKHFIKCL